MYEQSTTPPRPQYTPRTPYPVTDRYSELVHESWLIALQAANRAASTQRCYLETADQLHAYLLRTGRPTEPRRIRRQDLEAYLADQLSRFRPATAAARHKALRQWFRWLAEEHEIGDDPMARVKAPHVPEQSTPVLAPSALKALLNTCSGRGFQERRDYALLCLLIDSGLRRSEAAGLRVDDVDLQLSVCRVMGKGQRSRVVPFGTKTAAALDRYRRVRRDHPAARTAAWWLGHVGPMSDEGVYEIVKRRAEQAGLDVHPHQLRHQFAHAWLAGGGQEGDLMRLAGWRSRQMLNRYGASAADERAREAYRSRSQVDGL